MKILICGSWENHKANQFALESRDLGKKLGEAGFDLILGSGTGVARFVLEGFNSSPKHGKSIFYLPDLKDMKRVGEEMGEGADLVIQTGEDYPSRNLVQIKMSDALAVLGGADATVSEIINAILDYQKPVVLLENSEIAKIIKLLPKTGHKVYYARNVKSMVQFLKLLAASPKTPPHISVHTA